MKLLAVADIHGAQYRLNILLEQIVKYRPDLVVLCGDLTQFGPVEVALGFLDQIQTETLAIHGNIDTTDVAEALLQQAGGLHLRSRQKAGVWFVGIGGEIPARLSQVMIQDKEEERALSEVVDQNTVLVTHVPPYKTQDTVFLGHHAGSKELRGFIDEKKPKVVLCGHIHEDPGVTRLDHTVVVNCSMGKKTAGALIEISDSVTVEILE